MRRRTRRQLRFAVVFAVAALVAVMAGAVVALATVVTTPPPVCFVDQFDSVDQEHGAGSTSHSYTVNGQTVVVHFSWTSDKHLTVWVTGGTFTSLTMKAGNHQKAFGPGAGPYSMYVENPGQANNGNALSHMDFCLLATPCTSTTAAPTTTSLASRGTLKISKTISGDNPYQLGYAAFSVTVKGPNGYTYTGSFNGSGNIELNNLAEGQYTIDETDPGYPFSVSGEGEVFVKNDHDHHTDVNITNRGSTTTSLASRGTLKISKTISGDNPYQLGYAAFSVTVKGPNGYTYTGSFNSSGNIELNNLAEGQYTIDETDPGYPFSVSGEGGVSVSAGQQTGVTIVNNGSTTTIPRLVGSLRITNTIKGYNPNNLGFEDFMVVVTGPSPSSNVVYTGYFDTNGEILLHLDPGWYTVTEAPPGEPWTVAGEGPVLVELDKEALQEIINTGSVSTTLGVPTTGTPATVNTTTRRTVLGFSNTSRTVMGWIAQPDNIQTGGGGTAGGLNWGALIALVLAGTTLVGVVTASVLGVRHGAL